MKKNTNSQEKSLLNRLTSTKAAIVLGGLAIVVVVLGSLAQHGVIDIHLLLLDLWSNGGTELASIAITVFVIDGLNRRRTTQERKKALILQMGSPDNGFALEAVRILRSEEWLTDGSLCGKIFTNANLQKAELSHANLKFALLNNGCDLREANFTEAKLQGADLGGSKFGKLSASSDRAATFWHAKLRRAILSQADLSKVNFGYADLSKATLVDTDLTGAILEGADLQGADLSGAKFDENTILPDNNPVISKWKPDTDMTRFTDPNHADFWRSDNPDSPAYRGSDAAE